MQFERIVLTGFMGAGKSTVGRLLALRLGWQFSEVDDRLVERSGLAIHEIFVQHGEPHFRELEASVIEDLLKLPSAVIALGGGALERASTRAQLQSSQATLIVYLETSLATAIERCNSDRNPVLRPVLQDREGLSARFARRIEAYEAADFTLSTEALAPAAIVERIVARLDNEGAAPL